MPMTLLAMGLNSPRMPSGALGLRSHMSCVPAPPSRYSAMTLFALALRRGCRRASSARNRCGSEKAPPSADSAPALSVSRRVMPSQQRRGLPSMVSMGHLEERGQQMWSTRSASCSWKVVNSLRELSSFQLAERVDHTPQGRPSDNSTGTLFELLDHLLGDVLLAGLGPVVAVVGEEALWLVVRVVLLPVVDKRLTEVNERELLLPGDGASGVGQGI